MTPKILTVDVEVAPIIAYIWNLHDQNVNLQQVKSDWYMLSWACKWLDEPASKVMYMDNRKAKNLSDDKHLVSELVKILNQADIVISQNGESFDTKKINARAVINGLPPIKPYKSTDILKEGRKVFKFTSHKLEYLTETLNKKYKKLKHSKYPGLSLWKAILNGDKKAWDVMKEYNIHDVLATEETYKVIQGWIKTQNLGCYTDGEKIRCKCGSTRLTKEGYARTEAGKYQVYHCKDCGKWPRGGKNLFKQEQRDNMTRDWR